MGNTIVMVKYIPCWI